MWIVKAYRWQESNGWYILSPKSSRGNNTRMTLASALAPPEQLSVEDNSAQSLQPAVFGDRRQERRPSGRCASSSSRSIPRSILTGKHIFHVTPTASILGLENKHALNMLFPKDNLTINIYQATNNWEYKGISHENFFIKNGIFGAQKMTQFVKCLTCMLKYLFDLQNSHFKSEHSTCLESQSEGGRNNRFLGLTSRSSILGKLQASKRPFLQRRIVRSSTKGLWCTHIHTHVHLYVQIHPCTHT